MYDLIIISYVRKELTIKTPAILLTQYKEVYASNSRSLLADVGIRIPIPQLFYSVT